ncbi:hypothetical protein EMIHUDRAFT_469610 [Emiliania huxleyi CCMP1516]|uniref:Uncharacterized protein n=2 Tax=Emiliania huxleyi TaxID=2903 RepID=A0A0D3JGD5_EMIH1|nr:hypothetical protein EMIHUDRAFT_469610 [Emiliania huxleyi CCMP1516]EOD22570.1 hypothetical protein EMIHUDRAFT_469610 [Emiliania huxleyi CCMP1516]|eukprot:XP_005774999.1 hypothetical protein EMIHUDRAFT_469610 [Emiliania huxleyi CCMP1516]
MGVSTLEPEGCLGTLYSHPQTTVLRLTSFPDGHETEDQAEGTNVAKYVDRGWCATESAWSSLTKAGALSLDLGLMRDGEEYDYYSLRHECTKGGGRRPPLLPSAFAAELETKSFTNGKDDKPLVKQLYEAAFEEQFGKATKLDYRGLGWGNAEAAQLAEVLASGAVPRLEELDLGDNKIGDEGFEALAAALGKEGAVPRLEQLYLEGNKIGDEGCKALAAALGKEGAVPRLENLHLRFNKIGDESCKALATALGKEGAAPRLETLELGFNQIGDESCKALAAALGKEGAAPRLETLELGFNQIGDEGCKALAAALGKRKEGAAPRLRWPYLEGNFQIGDEGCNALAAALGEEAAPELDALELSQSSLSRIGDEGCIALAAALGKEGAAQRLETIYLDGNSQVGDEGCKALAAALGKEGAVPRLKNLYLRDNQIGDEGCKALAAALGKEGAVPRLVRLSLPENKIGDEGCKALAAALKEGAAPSLKTLLVDGQPAELAALFEEQGAVECKELVAVCEERGINLPMQTELNYGFLGWGDAEATQLAEVLASGPRHWKLDLEGNKIGDEGCKALAAALGKEGAAPRLKELCLGRNQIGDEGCKALAAALGKEGAALRLETIYLDGNSQVGDEGCKALAAALGKEGAVPRLKNLYLRDNQIGDEGCKALAAALGKEGAVPRLKNLYLRDNQIGDEGCKALAAALGKGAAPRLVRLSLPENKIGDEGCKALAAALKEGAAPSLKTLLVDGQPAELAALFEEQEERAAPRLEELWLNSNKIGDEGCKALAAALKEGAAPSLKMLDMGFLFLFHNKKPELVAVCEERGITLR